MKKNARYIIAITEVNTTTKSDDKIKNKKTFNIYDGYLFLSYYNSKFDPLDPRTNLPIQKVYYFAVCCFFPELLMYKYEKRSHTFEPHFISRPDLFDKKILQDHNVESFEKFQRLILKVINSYSTDKQNDPSYILREQIAALITGILDDAKENYPNLDVSGRRWYYTAKRIFDQFK